MQQTLKDISVTLTTHSRRLSEYDQTFLIDIAYMLQNDKRITQRQYDHLERILNRSNMWTVMDLKRTKDML